MCNTCHACPYVGQAMPNLNLNAVTFIETMLWCKRANSWQERWNVLLRQWKRQVYQKSLQRRTIKAEPVCTSSSSHVADNFKLWYVIRDVLEWLTNGAYEMHLTFSSLVSTIVSCLISIWVLMNTDIGGSLESVAYLGCMKMARVSRATPAASGPEAVCT